MQPSEPNEERNISEQECVECQKQRRRYEAALSSILDFVYIFDLDHRLIYVNEPLLKVWGLSWEEAKGKNCHEIGYEKWLADKHDKEMEQVIATKKPIKEEIPFTGTNGTRIYEYIFVPVLGKDGEVEAIAGTTRDVTERKKIEEELRGWTKHLEERVSERTHLLEEQAIRLQHLAIELTHVEQNERKRLAALLHDHIQQLLVATKLRLNLLERKSNCDKKEINEATTFVDEAYEASRSLTAQLSPPVLYEEGLGAALAVLAKKVEGQYRIKVNIEIDRSAEPSEDFVKIMIYQCVQELLFNVVKYAKVSECFLSMKKFSNKSIVVSVIDKGVGFNPSQINGKVDGGFGLFSIRERVKVFDGEFRILSSPGKGTESTIIIPEKIGRI